MSVEMQSSGATVARGASAGTISAAPTGMGEGGFAMASVRSEAFSPISISSRVGSPDSRVGDAKAFLGNATTIAGNEGITAETIKPSVAPISEKRGFDLPGFSPLIVNPGKTSHMGSPDREIGAAAKAVSNFPAVETRPSVTVEPGKATVTFQTREKPVLTPANTPKTVSVETSRPIAVTDIPVITGKVTEEITRAEKTTALAAERYMADKLSDVLRDLQPIDLQPRVTDTLVATKAADLKDFTTMAKNPDVLQTNAPASESPAVLQKIDQLIAEEKLQPQIPPIPEVSLTIPEPESSVEAKNYTEAVTAIAEAMPKQESEKPVDTTTQKELQSVRTAIAKITETSSPASGRSYAEAISGLQMDQSVKETVLAEEPQSSVQRTVDSFLNRFRNNLSAENKEKMVQTRDERNQKVTALQLSHRQPTAQQPERMSLEQATSPTATNATILESSVEPTAVDETARQKLPVSEAVVQEPVTQPQERAQIETKPVESSEQSHRDLATTVTSPDKQTKASQTVEQGDLVLQQQATSDSLLRAVPRETAAVNKQQTVNSTQADQLVQGKGVTETMQTTADRPTTQAVARTVTASDEKHTATYSVAAQPENIQPVALPVRSTEFPASQQVQTATQQETPAEFPSDSKRAETEEKPAIQPVLHPTSGEEPEEKQEKESDAAPKKDQTETKAEKIKTEEKTVVKQEQEEPQNKVAAVKKQQYAYIRDSLANQYRTRWTAELAQSLVRTGAFANGPRKGADFFYIPDASPMISGILGRDPKQKDGSKAAIERDMRRKTFATAEDVMTAGRQAVERFTAVDMADNQERTATEDEVKRVTNGKRITIIFESKNEKEKQASSAPGQQAASSPRAINLPQPPIAPNARAAHMVGRAA